MTKIKKVLRANWSWVNVPMDEIFRCFCHGKSFESTPHIHRFSSSRIDHDRSASECTVDPCSTSPVEFYSLNQTIDSVYVANKFDYAFLKLFSRLALRLAKIIFYLLIMFLVLSSLLSICFVLILHFHKRSQKLIHPNGSIMTNASIYTRGGTVHLANSNSIPQNSTSSTKSLIVPTQVNPTVTVEQTKVEQ